MKKAAKQLWDKWLGIAGKDGQAIFKAYFGE